MGKWFPSISRTTTRIVFRLRIFLLANSAARWRRRDQASETKHLIITTAASNDIARPGLRIALSLDIELKPGMHLYAPGVEGYIPIDYAGSWRRTMPAAKRHAFTYPPSEMLRLEAIKETVPVYRGRVRIVREITFGQEGALKPLVTPTGELIIKGSFSLSGVRRSDVLPSARRGPSNGDSATRVWIGNGLRRSSSASRSDKG